MRSGYTLDKIYYELLDYLNINNEILIGLGRSSSWSLESMPNSVDITRRNVEQLFGFTRLTSKQIVCQALSSQDADTVVLGEYYRYVNGTVEDLRQNFCREILLTASLDHIDLPVDSYRSLGIYTNCVLHSSVLNTDRFILPEKVLSRRLIYLENHPPIAKQPGVVSTIRRIIKCQ